MWLYRVVSLTGHFARARQTIYGQKLRCFRYLSGGRFADFA
jgi:hypothetical protein